MAAVIDMLQDVEQKFSATVVMYQNRAVLCKSVSQDLEKPGQYLLHIYTPTSRGPALVNLLDPALNYQDFNIGYVNCGAYGSWWYRKPHKQWSQGLKAAQMGWKVSTPGGGPGENFGFNKNFIRMLENTYPSIEECKKTLMDREGYVSIGFHRDFALSYDDLHEDFLLEYHGVRIGTSLDKDLKQFKIKADARHLIEALQEARNVHS